MIRATAARRFSPSDPDISRGVDVYLLLAAGLLIFIGLASLYSIDYSRGTAWFPKQALWCAVGIVPFLVLWLSPAKLWQRASAGLYALSIGLLGAVLVLGPTIGGAQRWLDLGSGLPSDPKVSYGIPTKIIVETQSDIIVEDGPEPNLNGATLYWREND